MSSPALGRGAILYDYLHCRGGAEQLTLELMNVFPDSDLWVGYRDRAAFPEPLPRNQLHELRLPARFRGGRMLLGLVGFRLATRQLAGYDWAIFSGSVAPEGVYHRPSRNNPRRRNLYYCHTLPRFAYDLQAYYRARLPAWAHVPFRAVAALTRRRYQQALSRMDLILTNSENVRGRMRRHIGLDARVVYPPCDTTGFRWLGQGDYYLSTARLEPYKRVDDLVAAFRQLPRHRLVIASGGSDEARLRRLAAGVPNISFTGWLDADQLRNLVGRCIATLYVAQDEDFGMSPVESMAAGKPVIAAAEGGLLETVLDGETGVLIREDLSSNAVAEAVRTLSPGRAARMRAACEERSRDFTIDRFADRMRTAVAEAMDA